MIHSLVTKITFIFSVVLLLVCVLFMLLYRFEEDKNATIIQQNQFASMNYLLQLYASNSKPQNIVAYFNFFNLVLVKNKNLIKSVMKNGEVRFDREVPIGRFASIVYNDKYYLHVNYLKENILLESKNVNHTMDYLWIGLLLSFGLIIMTYLSIIKSFKPLRVLSSNMRRFGQGNFEISYKSNEKDEIAQVANEFDKAVKKIKDLLVSRQLFLRSIMHELKTPIGKGRIVAEMIQDEVQKKRLINIFERLNDLIKEFSKMEQIASKSYDLTIESHSLKDLFDESIEMLLLDKTQIENSIFINIKDETIKCDYELMKLVLKNLIDNALEHSVDKRVYVKNIDNGIRVSNSGDSFKEDINYYYGAFVHNPRSKGLGLGLYIVKNILDYHEFKLNYSYEKHMHNFDIIWSKSEKSRKF